MKKFLFVAALLVLCLKLSAQTEVNESVEAPVVSPAVAVENEPSTALTIGVLNGGGSLIGFDFEVMMSKRFGIQAGAGINSYGAGLNYHLKDGIRSSMLSLLYSHQGFGGDSFYMSYLGPAYTFRARKLFTCSLGLGYVLKRGPAWYDIYTDSDKIPVLLTYSIGIYLPF